MCLPFSFLTSIVNIQLFLPPSTPALSHCPSLVLQTGAGAHALGVGWGGVCGRLTSALPPPSLSALYPATAARQGGRVAANLVDSSEFGTADERRYCS